VTYRLYSEEEIEYIRQNYQTMTLKVLAERLHRNKDGLKRKIEKMSLRKRAPYIKTGRTATKEGKKAYMKQYHVGYMKTETYKNYRIKQHERTRLRYAQDSQYRSERQQKTRRKFRTLQKQIGEIIRQVGKCERCGFSDLQALQIHHQFGREKKISQYQEMKQVIQRKVPFAVLCANCHVILHGNNKRFL
jgi:hypothetical protein